MTLHLDIRHRQGSFDLHARLDIGAGLTAIFGPSGSGKSTLVNLIAGLIRPDDGRIAFGGTVWSDSAAGRFVPAHKRRIGYVFQEARLFPHMTVRQNLTYGTRTLPRGEAHEDLGRVADLLGISGLLERRPSRLSGGEKQRVALGRALMSAPRLLLMDEPLSALDHALKSEILPDLERIRDEAGVPVVYVSHSVEEVSRLATRVVAMDGGRATTIGGPDALLSHVPMGNGAFPAGSFLHAVVREQRAGEGVLLAEAKAGIVYLAAAPVAPGRRVRAHIPASDVILATERPNAISTLNCLEGVVVEMAQASAGMLVTVDCSGDRLLARITAFSAHRLGLEKGRPVFALFKAVSVSPDELYRDTRT